MRVLRIGLVALLLGSAPAWAAPASEASIRELLSVTQAAKLLEGVRAPFDGLMGNMIQMHRIEQDLLADLKAAGQ